MKPKRGEIIGHPVDPETGRPLDLPEHEHFHTCSHCGQSVDRRDLGQVLHHEEPEHEPMREEAESA